MENVEGVSLTQNAGLVGISKFVNTLGLLAASVILTRFLSRAEYGNYEQVWLVYNSFLPLIGYGLASSVYFHSAREDKRLVYSSAGILTAFVGIVSGIFLAILAPVIAELLNAQALTTYIRIFAVYAVVSSPSLIFESVFITEHRVGLLLVGNILMSALLAMVIFVSAVFYHSLTLIFMAIGFVGIVKSLYLFIYLFRQRKIAYSGLSPVMKAQLFYAVPIIVSSITGTLSRQVDRYLVTLFYSPDQFAIYTIGAKEIPMIAVITGSASEVLFPVFSELGSNEMVKKFVEIWKNSISKTAVFLLPMMAFLFFATKDFMEFFFGEKYIPSAGIFRILLMLVPLRLAFYSSAMLSLGKQKLFMYSSIAELFLSGGISYVLIQAFGIEGAAVGKVLATYIQVTFLAGVLIVALKTSIIEFFPWWKLVKVSLISVLCLAPLFFIRGYIESVYVRFLVEGMLYAVCFGGTAILTGLVRVIDLRKLRFVVS